MDIKVNTKILHTALQSLERIIGKNVSLPILTTILFKTEKNKLKLASTNLEMGEIFFIPAKIEKEGEVAVPCRVISALIGSLNSETVELSAQKETLFVKTDDLKTKILGMKTDEFPIIPEIVPESTITLPAQESRHALASVVDAVSLSESRPELTGVYMQCNKKEISFAATDSFRLSEYIMKCDCDGGGEYIIPRSAAIEIMRLLDTTEPTVTISLGLNQIGIKNESFVFISRLIEGKYPNYKKIIPERYVSKVSVDRSDMLRRISTASIFSSNIADVTLSTNQSGIIISSKNVDKGEYTTAIPGTVEGKNFSISLNYQYILDGIKIFSSPVIDFLFTGEGSPFMLRSQEDSGATYVIMPLRT